MGSSPITGITVTLSGKVCKNYKIHKFTIASNKALVNLCILLLLRQMLPILFNIKFLCYGNNDSKRCVIILLVIGDTFSKMIDGR